MSNRQPSRRLYGMGWFSDIVKASKDSYNEAKTASQANKQPAQPAPKPLATGGLVSDPVADYKELLALYKSMKFADNLDIAPFVKKVNPHAAPSACPYCAVQHPFTAKRARKCPDCGKKMVVRHGVFLTEQQTDKLESLISQYYTEQSAWNRLGSELSNAQNAQLNKQVVDLLLGLAQGFVQAAKLANKKDPKGFDYWDKSWRYFNEARIKEAQQADGYFNRLSSISYDMADALVDQALNATKSEKSKKRLLSRALQQIIFSIGEGVQFDSMLGIGIYAYERAKLIMRDAELDNSDVDEDAARTVQALRLNPQQLQQFNQKMADLKSYEIIGDRELF